MVMALRNDRDNDDVMRMLMCPVGGRRKIGRKGNKGDLSGEQARIIISLSHKTRVARLRFRSTTVKAGRLY